MRNRFCESLVRQANNPDFVFLTGDLGFGALEPLQKVLGSRFINTGVAEQNMVGVAAGLAHEGMLPWVYSIAPFLYARAYEQIRNDIAMHRLPVVLVGNGGGYGYGAMGATHHALEDCALMATLSPMRVIVPAFQSDIPTITADLFHGESPAYLRLGRCEAPTSYDVPLYRPWRKLIDGNGPVIVTIGPLAGGYLSRFLNLDTSERPSLWLVGELPLKQIPPGLEETLRQVQKLMVIEEHQEVGSLGTMLCSLLFQRGITLQAYKHIFAKGYPSASYGSQQFHRQENGLSPDQVATACRGL
jgi:transketolase